MTSSEMIEDIYNHAYKAYKKNSRGSREARMLDRHEPVELEGQTFS